LDAADAEIVIVVEGASGVVVSSGAVTGGFLLMRRDASWYA
jgi:hypothetical protein